MENESATVEEALSDVESVYEEVVVKEEVKEVVKETTKEVVNREALRCIIQYYIHNQRQDP